MNLFSNGLYSLIFILYIYIYYMTKVFHEVDIRQLTEFGSQCQSQCRSPNHQCFGAMQIGIFVKQIGYDERRKRLRMFREGRITLMVWQPGRPWAKVHKPIQNCCTMTHQRVECNFSFLLTSCTCPSKLRFSMIFQITFFGKTVHVCVFFGFRIEPPIETTPRGFN